MDPDIRSVILKDPDMDRPIKNPVQILSKSDKINGYGYQFRLIRSEPDPLEASSNLQTFLNVIKEKIANY